MEDFEGIKHQIHSKIRDKIDENPASEEEEENKDRAAHGAAVIGETSPSSHSKIRNLKQAFSEQHSIW